MRRFWLICGFVAWPAWAAAQHPLPQEPSPVGMTQVEHTDPSDGRRVVIEAPKAGRARFEAHVEARAAEVAAAAAVLTDAERAELARLLAKLADAWPD